MICFSDTTPRTTPLCVPCQWLNHPSNKIKIGTKYYFLMLLVFWNLIQLITQIIFIWIFWFIVINWKESLNHHYLNILISGILYTVYRLDRSFLIAYDEKCFVSKHWRLCTCLKSSWKFCVERKSVFYDIMIMCVLLIWIEYGFYNLL